MILRKFQIGPIDFEIRGVEDLVDENDESVCGIYHEGNYYAEVNTSRSKKEQRMAALHESFHAWSYFLGLGLTENKVRCLELSMFQAYENELMKG